MSSSSGGSGRDKAARDPGGQPKAARSGKTKRRARRGKGGRSGESRETAPNTPDQDTPNQDTAPERQDTGAVPGGSRQRSRRARRMRTVLETSAGGLVVDAQNSRAAVIGRLDRRGRLLWSLPKGHIESGETAEQAAVREVAEETGIAAAVVAALGSIDYWFVTEDRRVHKTVHHFLLRAHGGELSDADMEVTAVAWVPLPDLQRRLAYADERRLVRRATDLLVDPA